MAATDIHETPFTDWAVRAGILMGTGFILGGFAGFIGRLVARPLVRIVLRREPAHLPGYGDFITICGPIGALAVLALYFAEYYRLL